MNKDYKKYMSQFTKKEQKIIRTLLFNLDFFDNRAFTDNNPNGPCYCTSPNQDEDDIKRMVGEFKESGVKDTLRRYAVEMLNQKKIQGG